MTISKTKITVSTLISALLSQTVIAEQPNTLDTELVVLPDLTVKARQYEEPLQQVPFTVETISAQQANSLNTTADFDQDVPGFSYTDSGIPEANLLNIRGIGSSSTFLSPSVTYYVDGVPVPQRVFDMTFVDIKSIELLKGPQGTLFGQNSQAGAVNIITKQPSKQKQLNMGLDYSSYNALKLALSGSSSLTDTLAARAAIKFSKQDGDINNVSYEGATQSSEEQALRASTNLSGSAKILFEPNKQSRVTLSGHKQDDERNPSTGLLLNDEQDWKNAYSFIPENTVNSSGGALKIEHDLSALTITSITGLQQYDLSLLADITDGFLANAGSGFPVFAFQENNAIREISEDLQQWSQELRINGETSNGSVWVVGASALFSEFNSSTEVTHPMMPNGKYSANIEKLNYGLFSELTYALNTRTRLIAGLRASSEQTDFSGLYEPKMPMPEFNEQGTEESNLFTGRLAISYDLNDSMSTFATYAKGAKAGGYPFYNQSAAFNVKLTAFSPSYTDSFEAGIKGYLLNKKLYVTATAFVNNTQDEQLFIFNPMISQFDVENADTQSVGTELQLISQLTDSLKVDANLGLIDAKATQDNAKSVKEGNLVPYSPKIKSSVKAEYTLVGQKIGIPGQIQISSNYQHIGDRYIDPANSKQLASYDLTNLELSYQLNNINLYSYVDNAFDSQYVQSGFAGGMTPGGERVFGGIPGQGRIIGVGFDVKY